MRLSTHTTRRLIQAIALAIVVTGLAVPGAAGKRNLPRTASRVGAPISVPAGEPKNQAPFTRPAADASVAAATIQGETKNTAPFNVAVTARPEPVVVRTASGFEWGDAAIGAIAATGLALAAFGATLFVRASRTHRSAAAA
jgi:hypothetical protein